MNKSFTQYSITKAGFLACLFLWTTFSLHSQELNWDDISLKAYQYTLDLETAQARNLIPTPSTVPGIYLNSLASSMEILLSEDASRLEAYEEQLEKWTSRKIEDNPADELFLQAELHLQRAFVLLKFGHEFDAAMHLRSAYQQIRELRNKYPSCKGALKTSGLLNVLIGSVPEKYNWILGLLNMEGSVQKGLEEMESLRNLDHPLAFETNLWLSFIQGFVLQEPVKAIEELKKLQAGNPENRMVLFVLANLYMKNSSSEDALSALEKLQSIKGGISIPYTHYLKGEVFLHKAKYEKAIQSYQHFLKSYRGQNYIKDAWYKTGLCYWLDDNAIKANEVFIIARKSGKESTEADKHAARSLAEPDLPFIPLTKARYYTDGGYYKEANELLEGIEYSQLKVKHHQVEFFYRKARLAHKMTLFTEARKQYLMTIEVSGNEPWYYAPNSCLQLGYIAMEHHNLEEAKSYFKKALEYKRHEYKNSIDSKARSALAQLEDFK